MAFKGEVISSIFPFLTFLVCQFLLLNQILYFYLIGFKRAFVLFLPIFVSNGIICHF